jgi:hypothetical protein
MPKKKATRKQSAREPLAALGPAPESYGADKRTVERLHRALPKASPVTLRWLAHGLALAARHAVAALGEGQRPKYLMLEAGWRLQGAAARVLLECLLDELAGGCLTVAAGDLTDHDERANLD